MNLKEAYSTLELSEGASPEDAKKKYRELTKKYHPDVNKDPGADAKFKKINEAYQCVKEGKGNDPEPMMPGWGGGNPFEGFNPFGRRNKPQSHEHIVLSNTISFEESILGTKKEVSFHRKAKCQSCNGAGEFEINNGCDKCNGKGKITAMRGNMVFVQTCPKCMGRVSVNNCNSCKSTGSIDSTVSINVVIPGGVTTGNILRIPGMGNFAGQFMSMDQFTDVHLRLDVTPDPELSLQDNYVVCKTPISLLDALRGCQKPVRTVLGEQEISIPPMSKNNDVIMIPRVGINKTGDQKVILEVQYPPNTDQLIEFLERS